jgi:hypothetical protein
MSDAARCIYAVWPPPLVIAHERYHGAMKQAYALYRAYGAARGNDLRCAFLADQIKAAEREEDDAWDPWEELYQLWMDGQL